MNNHQNNTLKDGCFYNSDYFNNPVTKRQKQYEAVRAIIVEGQSIEIVAKRFDYKRNTIYSLVKDFKAGKIELFPNVKKGPKQQKTTQNVQDRIINFRKQGLSTSDIHSNLKEEDINISAITIERILKRAGFVKLKRRTNIELGKTVKNKIIPQRSQHINFTTLEEFNIDCPTIGVFFFIPYILESGIIDVLKQCNLPQSSDIGSTQASLSMLLLKLIGIKRLTHIGAYDQEPGLGVFSGLNVLPKPTYMNTYSCRCSEEQLMNLQNQVISIFKNKYSNFYNSDYINLDFHSIPHYGDESEMEKIWCGAKGKTMKGANTIFASDSQSNVILYTRADILRREEVQEVKKFINFWKNIKGDVNETLVFDCKFTTYKILDDLQNDNIKFITLRKRYASLLSETLTIPKDKWQKVYIPIPKRKYKHVSIWESDVQLINGGNTFRQIVVKDHGRVNPTFILTNNKTLALQDVLKVYAKRWHIENKLAELVAFFNLNSLSSPIMIRIHFDILWTMIADTFYRIFARDIRRFEDNLAPSIFSKFINMPGRVTYDGNKFIIKIRKRAYTPVLMGMQKLQTPLTVPWLDGKTIEIVWTA
jgi:transposase